MDFGKGFGKILFVIIYLYREIKRNNIETFSQLDRILYAFRFNWQIFAPISYTELLSSYAMAT